MISATTTSRPTHSARLRHIRELDGARGIAALMVFFHHVCFASIRTGPFGHGIPLLRSLSASGNTGVDLFFVLSGFLITTILVETRHRKSFFPDFYWKRTLRILPLYVLCLALVLALNPQLWRGVLLSALFIVNFGSLFHVSMFGPFWTLAIEEQFYLVWPRVVRSCSINQLARWSITLAITCMLIRLGAGDFNRHNYYYTFYHCDGLALGALIACWFEQRTNAARERKLENLVLNGGFIGGVALVAFSAYFLPPGYPGFTAASLQTGITLIAASFIGRLVRDAGHPYLAPMRWPAITFFGLISYAFYMLHLFVLEAYDHFHRPLTAGDDLAFLNRLLVVLAVSVAAALVSRYVIELPALSLRRHVLKSPSAPAITSESLNVV